MRKQISLLSFVCSMYCIGIISTTSHMTGAADNTFFNKYADQYADPKLMTKIDEANIKEPSIKESKANAQTVAKNKTTQTRAQKFASFRSQQKKKKQKQQILSENKQTNKLSPITNNNESEESLSGNDELINIIKDKSTEQKQWIDTMNFIQPSVVSDNPEIQNKADLLLTRTEQEQLLILWRSTLERNKTIRFIVQKLAPDNTNNKRNQVLSQVLNTAVFLPFYALQSVAPADTSALASYIGAGVASDIINGVNSRDKNKVALTQTEMVIMFMMIDNIAERVRDEFRRYKSELIDSLLAKNEMVQAKQEAVAALELDSPEARFLSQIRIRQLERESKRIDARLRSARITLLDLSGSEAVAEVDKLIKKELQAIKAL